MFVARMMFPFADRHVAGI